MKKIIFIALCLIVIPAFIVLANHDYAHDPALNDEPVEIKKADEKEKHPCPYYLEVKDPQYYCFKCHSEDALGSLKEMNPEAVYNYPNSFTKIIEEGGFKKGYFLVTDISSFYLDQALRYFNRHGIKEMTIEIFSPGGSLFEGWRMVGMLLHEQQKGVKVKTICHGWAASAGAVVFMAGEERLINKTAELMLHELWTFAFFKIESPSSKEAEAEELRHLQDTMSIFISERCNISKDDLDAKIKHKNYWLRGSEALELGLATGLLDE